MINYSTYCLITVGELGAQIWGGLGPRDILIWGQNRNIWYLRYVDIKSWNHHLHNNLFCESSFSDLLWNDHIVISLYCTVQQLQYRERLTSRHPS